VSNTRARSYYDYSSLLHGVHTGAEMSYQKLWIFRNTEIVGLISITDRCPRIFVCVGYI